MDRTFNVLVLTSGFPRFAGDVYGCFVFEGLEALARHGHRFHVITPKQPGSRPLEAPWLILERVEWPHPQEFRPFEYFRAADLWRVAFLVRSMAKTLAALRADEYDLIDLQNIAPVGLAAWRSGILRKLPTVATTHGSEVRNLHRNPLARALLSRVFAETDLVTPVSPEHLDYLGDFGVSTARMQLLPNGVDTDRFRPAAGPPAPGLAVGLLGGLKGFRGPETVIEAVALARSETDDLRVLIAGDGPLRPQLERRVQELGVGDVCRFLGWLSRDQVPGFLRDLSVSIFASPTSNDSSVALREAMACGNAIIATDTGWTRDLIKPGVTGLLCRQDPWSIAEALLRYHRLPELRRQCGEAARRSILKSFSLENRAARVADLYRDAIAGCRGTTVAAA